MPAATGTSSIGGGVAGPSFVAIGAGGDFPMTSGSMGGSFVLATGGDEGVQAVAIGTSSSNETHLRMIDSTPRPIATLAPPTCSIGAMNEERSRALVALAARRWRIALVLTGAMLATYFGFVLLVAYDKPLLGTILTPGLSLGIVMGIVVILVAWALTGIYVRWANRVYDAELARARVIGASASAKDGGADAAD